MGDEKLNPPLRDGVQGLRGGMIGALNNRIPLPERFVQLAAKQSNQVTFLDTYTGRELTVGFCDAHGARMALAAFFSTREL